MRIVLTTLSTILIMSSIVACTNQEVGTAAGAVGGGIVGNAVTGGSAGGTVVGAVGGAVVGNALSR